VPPVPGVPLLAGAAVAEPTSGIVRARSRSERDPSTGHDPSLASRSIRSPAPPAVAAVNAAAATQTTGVLAAAEERSC
jgi:hypothetical protein